MKANRMALTLLASVALHAAHLQPEAQTAWNDYIQAAKDENRQRVASQKSFLWIDESPERAASIRRGEIAAAHLATVRAPSGLIHHWIGAMFIANVRLDEVFSVLRDERRYREYYTPAVVDSRIICQERAGGGFEDRFSLVLMNKAVVTKVAIDGDYQSLYVPVDARRWYSISRTTRVQEIHDYGQPGEERLAAGAGSGLIWDLFSISRFEERDGGVVVEVEAMALSRDIPAGIRWFVSPIVQRVARNSILTSLRQTQAATVRQMAERSSGARGPASAR